MRHVYDQRKRPQGSNMSEPRQTTAPGPGMDALINGTARPTAAQKGQPFDLDAAMKAKMENAFGDLSAVKFYKSQAVGDAGAEAIAQGNEIAFAPGMTDFSTKAGQERLGHELSHVMSQRSGQVRGSGFLNDSSLEARADREGAMAAAGRQVCAGPVTHTFSDAAPSPFMAGAMQAKRRDADAKAVKKMQQGGTDFNWNYAVKGSDLYDELDPEQWVEKTHTPGFSRHWGKKPQTYKVRKMDEKQKEISQAADDLLAVHFGINNIDPNDPSQRPVKDEEREWYQRHLEHPMLPLMKELAMRSDVFAKKW